MWWLSIPILGLLAGSAVWFRFIPPPQVPTLLLLKHGDIQVRRGQLVSHARQAVADTLKEGGVASGFIAITASRRVVFARTIPPSLHQRLRNILIG
jgi:hypothetical protein